MGGECGGGDGAAMKTTDKMAVVAAIVVIVVLLAAVVAAHVAAQKRLDTARAEGRTAWVERTERYTDRCWQHKYGFKRRFGCFFCTVKYRTNMVEVIVR